jgi:hypothetical protein
VRTLVRADVALARLAGVRPGLLARQNLREPVRAIAVDRDAPIALPAVLRRTVMAVEPHPACSGLEHTALALLQLFPSDDISRANTAATPDDQRIQVSILTAERTPRPYGG